MIRQILKYAKEAVIIVVIVRMAQMVYNLLRGRFNKLAAR